MAFDLSVGDTRCEYNGVSMNDARTKTLAIDIKPHFDGAGRAVVWHDYTVTIWGLVAPPGVGSPGNDDANAVMPDIERALLMPAGELRYESKGLGHSFHINRPGGGGRRDVAWGPKTLNLKVETHGDIVNEITWTFNVKLAACPSRDARFRIMEFVYRLNFDIDSSGYSRRTYSGYFCIPQTRKHVNDRRLSDTADKYRELIEAAVPSGFRPISKSFPLSEDKCRMDFALVAEEMPPNIPPPGVVHATASHSSQTNKFMASTSLWGGTIRGSYEVERGREKTTGLKAFIRLANERKEEIEKRLPPSLDGGARFKVLWSSLSIEEPEIYGKLTCTAALTYTTVLNRKVLLEGAGLWRPLGDSDWRLWAQSLANSVFHIRGNAKLKHLADEDVMVDLCDDTKPETPLGRTTELRTRDARESRSELINKLPPPGASYLRYRSFIRVEVVDEVIELKSLPGGKPNRPDPRPQPPKATTPGDLGGLPPGGEFLGGTGGAGAPFPPVVRQVGSQTVTDLGNNLVGIGSGGGGGVGPADTGGDPPSIMTRARPTIAITLFGQACRAGYPVIPPSLLRVGRHRAVPANSPGNGFTQGVIADWFGVALFGASWNFRWLVAGIHGDLPIPANPLVLPQ